MYFHVVSRLRYDQAAAAAAVAACRDAARTVDAVLAAHAAARAVAVLDWAGPHRDAFDEAWARWQRALDAVGDDLRRSAARIASTAAVAAAMDAAGP